MVKLFPVYSLLLMVFASPAVSADDWGPWESPQPASPAKSGRKEVVDSNPLKLGIHIHQKFISPVDGPRCPMYPTCSAYALDALNKHGSFIGVMMTVDRLLHDIPSQGHRQLVKVGSRWRFHYPVEYNDFWFVKQ